MYYLAIDRGPFSLVIAIHSLYIIVTTCVAAYLFNEKVLEKIHTYPSCYFGSNNYSSWLIMVYNPVYFFIFSFAAGLLVVMYRDVSHVWLAILKLTRYT